MTKDKIQKILELHKKWNLGETGGERADLQDADLRGADLRDAKLRDADLQDANLRDAKLQDANLRGADLQDADLRDANLRGADLQDANLRDADLRRAKLQDADLRGANLQGANLDFSCWPLWCGTTNITIDSKISKQLVYHAICNMPDSDRRDFLDDPVAYANRFRRVGDVAKIKWAEQAQKGSK